MHIIFYETNVAQYMANFIEKSENQLCLTFLNILKKIKAILTFISNT